MSVDMSGLSPDSAVEKVMGLLGDDDTPGAEVPIDQLSDEAKADRIANEADPKGEVTGEPEQEQGAAETPLTEAPPFWDADAKEKFKALGPEFQKLILDKERERESNYGKTARETAEAKKAVEAERQAVQTAQQQYAEKLKFAVVLAENIDPIIAQGRKIDWVQEHQTDPLGAPARYLQYQQRELMLQQIQREYGQTSQQVSEQSLKQAHEQLTAKLDFWGDEAKRSTFQKDLRTYLKAEGLDDATISGLNHPVAITTARKAMLYDQLMAQQKSIADHKTVKPAPKTVLKSQASSDSDKSDRMANALKRVRATSRLDEQAAAIAAALE